MDRKKRRALRELNAKAWVGHGDPPNIQTSLDSSLKKNTAFIKRLRTAITAASAATFLHEIASLSLHKYLSEVISATYEGLCKAKTPGEIAAAVEVVSALHQRFGPEQYTAYLGWLLGRGLSTPDKSHLRLLTQEFREKEEKERLTRQRILLRVVTEFWLVGILRSLDDIVKPEDATARGKESSGAAGGKLGEVVSKGKSNATPSKVNGTIDPEPFPLEVLKDLLGHDKEHANLPLVVLFVKTFAWDVLGIKTVTDTQKNVSPDGHVTEVNGNESYDHSSAEEDAKANEKADDPPMVGSEIQQRFKNVLTRYFEEVKGHIERDQKSIFSQGRRNAEAYVKSGEVFEDRQANYDRQLKTQEKLISNAQVLCDALDDQEMPELRAKDNQEVTAAAGIGLVKTGDYLKSQKEGAGIWEDEDERRFYENLIDLQDRVPGILLEDPKKKKPENEEPVGKRVDDKNDAKPRAKDEAEKNIGDDQSTTIVNKTVGVQVDALLARLPELQNKDQADQLAIEFCFLNSKASRNRLIKAVQEVPKGRVDLYPLYSRLVATVGKYMADVFQGLVTHLDEEFRSLQRRKQKDFLSQIRTGNIRYLAELTKFGAVPEHVIFHCLKVSLDDFSKMNIEIICSLLENCGRFLQRNSDTAPRMSSFLETLQRKKTAQHLGQQERMLIENAVYYVNPPERAAIEQKERSPVDMFLSKLIYLEMNKRNYPKILKTIRKLHWEEQEVVDVLFKKFSKPAKVKYSNVHLLAVIIGSLYRYHSEFVTAVIDDLLEQITVGLEQNDFKSSQRRLAEVKYLGELYNYKMVDSPVIFDSLYRLVTFGHPGGTPSPDRLNPLDLPDDYFRIRLVCALLETCGACFDRGTSKKKLDFFLVFFQYYTHTKDALPLDVDFLVQDTFGLTRPQWKLATSIEEAGNIFADAVKQNYKTQEQEKGLEVEPADDEGSSEDEMDDDDIPVPVNDDAQSSGEEVEADADAEIDTPISRNDVDSDFEEDIVVTRQQQEKDPEAEAEFDREFAKMMAESMESRKFDRKALFDVPLPMRRAQKDAPVAGDDSGNEGTATPPSQSTMAFSLMTKKGGRQQTRNIEMPADSQFAISMRNQQEAERAEQQRIKSLVLNYDLQDSSADQAGTGSDLSHFDPFFHPNPNRPLRTGPCLPPKLEPPGIVQNGVAHEMASEGVGDKHHPNPAFHQHTHHGSNSRSGDKSISNRAGHRARKLQLSDVEWT